MTSSWVVTTVGQVVERHFSGPSPDCEERNVISSDEWGVLKTTAITWDGWDPYAHKVLPRAYWGQEDLRVQVGDVLVTKAGPRHRCGVVTHVTSMPANLVVSGKMIGLRPRSDMVVPRMLAAAIATAPAQKYLDMRTTGMAESQVNFTNDVLLLTPIFLPPLPEQHRIAETLDAIDATIQHTETLLTKLKQMKIGLLHDMLTYGLDEHGQLRDPVVHPEQFKDSPLGRIPREWEVQKLVEHFELPNGQVDPKQEPYRNWPLIAPDHIESGTGRLLQVQTALEQGAISGKYAFRSGDVLYSKIRPYLRKAVLADRDGLCSADMYPLRSKPTLVPRFLLAAILGEDFSRFATAVSMRSGFPKINREELSEYETALPPYQEQECIAKVLDIHDTRIRAEEAYRDKLKQLKQGLIDDLLTGRVRVTATAEG